MMVESSGLRTDTVEGGLLRNHRGMNRAETLLARSSVRKVAVRMMKAGFEGLG
jgi:hypothetical protein